MRLAPVKTVPEDLLTNMTLSPLLIAAAAGIAIVCFYLGWSAKGSGANKRENELKREILEAKGSVPLLESNVRSRDSRIIRLEEDLAETNDRNNDLMREVEVKKRELSGAQREAKNLTSEITAIRGLAARDPNNVIMDGFDDEAATPGEGESALQTQLRKTEALYEKLKDALISRDTRIDRLEAELEKAGSETTAKAPVALEMAQEQVNDEAHKLKVRLDQQMSLVADLQSQISDLNKEKVMLEELASRRSKSNRELKTASAEAEARVPELETEITQREQTIRDREVSIKRLIDDLDDTRKSLASREKELQSAQRQIETTREELQSVQPKIEEMRQRLQSRDQRIDALDKDFTASQQLVTDRQLELDTAREHIGEQEAEIAEGQTRLRAAEQTTASLRNAIKDREFRIETLETEMRTLKDSLSSAQNTASETLELSDKRHAVTAAEVNDAQQQVNALKRDAQDLQAQLEQRDQWMSKLKESLSEREVRVKEQQARADQLMTQLDGANQQLKAIDDSRQNLETSKHELEREIVALRGKAEQAEAELTEQMQSVKVFKSMIADRDFRIESLENDVISMGKARTSTVVSATPLKPEAVAVPVPTTESQTMAESESPAEPLAMAQAEPLPASGSST